MSKMTRAIYILGGIVIVLSAIKVLYSGCKYVKDHMQGDEEE